MRASRCLLVLTLAAALAGCAGDPHPASPDTPGDPWHPPAQSAPDATTQPPGPAAVTGHSLVTVAAVYDRQRTSE